MNIPIIISLFLVVLYVGYGALITEYKKELKTILGYAVIIGLLLVWSVYFLMFSGEYRKLDTLFYILIPIFSLAFIFILFRLSKTKSLKVVASQQSYWGVPHQTIFNNFLHKLDFKKDRVEVKVNEFEKKIYRRYSNDSEMMTGHIFLNIKNLELTKVKTLNDIESELYKKIYLKLQELVKIQELEINFEEKLKENNYILEYFLINCWELYTQRVNIGIVTLNVIATTLTEEELLGALDNVCLSSVKRNGAGLFYKYMEFKELLPDLEDEEQESNNLDSDSDEDF